MELTGEQVKQLNDFSSFLRFKKTWPFKKLIHSEDKITALFTGNQFGKTAGVAMQYVMRILGIHPVVERNVTYKECSLNCGKIWRCYEAPETCECGGKVQVHERVTKTFRFCSETLPGQSGGSSDPNGASEVKNTQYPAFKKWLPGFLIKKDITFRSPTIIITDPHGGDDIIVEFVSYNQSVQSGAGVQRLSVWYDEEPDKEMREEQVPRLLAENGDEIFSVTPANYITWMYDEIFENARIYYRTPAICEFLKRQDGEDAKTVKLGNSNKSITVIQAATDDNPTLKQEAINALFDNIDDPEVIAIRRYGLFKQVSGRIFKDFDFNTHVIRENEFFEFGIPRTWVHGRGIDYHPQTPWAFGCMSLSPQNEAFIWAELNPSPERFTTEEIAEAIALKCSGYQFTLSLIDPLSEAFTHTENGKSITVREDLIRASYAGKYHTQGYWQTWDTKGEKGRDEIRKRLKNAKLCGKPFNNEVVENGLRSYLPTLWIISSCELTAKCMKQWRWEEYADSKSVQAKEVKNKPEQRWSHMNMVWEALFKSPSFRYNIRRGMEEVKKTKKRYYQGSG
jgi:hypothetical protein